MDEKLVELIGENGDRVSFEHLMTLEYMGNHYLVLHPCDPGVAEDEAVVFSVRADENGAECYEPVEDDETARKVFMEFQAILDMEED